MANNDNPELFKPYNKEEYLKESVQSHVVWPGFGYELDPKGHATVNYSIGGGTNIEAISQVEEALGLVSTTPKPVFYSPML